MSKKQTNPFNFIYLFFFLSIGIATDGFSAKKIQNLAHADSLFEQKKYTESYNIYETILLQEKHITPRMLLKMAFIKEGLGNYSEALYYLNMYYLNTSDKNAQSKMREIAETNSLSGFDINDKTFFVRQLRTYYQEIITIIFSIALIILGAIFYKKFKLQQKPVFSGISLVVILSLLFYMINFGDSTNEGIIMENHAYIMSGPSAGSDLLEVVKNGHKVKILKEMDVWMVIEWNGHKGYIKKIKVKKFS